jgi:hypothetical protein
MMDEMGVGIEWRALRRTELVFTEKDGTYGYVGCIGI